MTGTDATLAFFLLGSWLLIVAMVCAAAVSLFRRRSESVGDEREQFSPPDGDNSSCW